MGTAAKQSAESTKTLVLEAVKGFKEQFKVEQGIDPDVLTHYLEYDEEIVKEIRVDDQAIKWNEPGKYEAIYTIEAVLPEQKEETTIEITEKVPVQIMTPEEVEEDKKNGGDAISKEDFEADKKEEEKEPEQTETTKPETEDKEEVAKPSEYNKKPETSTTKPAETKPNTNTSTTTKPTTTPSKPAETKPTHTHNWEAQYKTVEHAEIGHTEQYVIKEAWTESIPVYEWQTKYICNDCHLEFPYEMIWDHIFSEMENGGKGSYTDSPVQVQVGTQTIQHPAEYGTRYVVDKPAWTEKVLTGYKCNCGATKN